MTSAKWGLSAVLLAMSAISVHAAIPGTVATYDVDEQGWQGSTTSTTQVYVGNGGNPGGHIEVRKDLTPPVFDIGSRTSADAAFLGDYAASGITGAGFDLNVFNSPVDNAFLRFRRNVAENGWRYGFGQVLPNANTWESFDVVFDPTWDDLTARSNGWLTDDDFDPGADPSPAFADVMADVGWIEVRLASEGSTIAGIDNVRIIPEPTTLGLCVLAVVVAMGRRARPVC